MSWGAAIGGLAGLASAGIGYLGQQQAARTAANATRDAGAQAQVANDQALAFLREGRDLARADMAPYRAAGLADYDAFRRNVGATFQASPGYEFARGEGIRAIDQAAAARGMLGSGGRLRELTRYGTGVANQEYNNWLSRLQGLAGVGQAASGQTASLAAGTGGQGASLLQQGGAQQAAYTLAGGQAAASGQVGQANALLGGLNQGLGIWALMRE